MSTHVLWFAPDTDDQNWGEARCKCGASYPCIEERLRRSTPRSMAEGWFAEHLESITKQRVQAVTFALADPGNDLPDFTRMRILGLDMTPFAEIAVKALDAYDGRMT